MSEANIWQPRTVLATSSDSKRIEEGMTAAASQTLFTITTFAYALGTGALEIFKENPSGDKVYLEEGVDWVEGTTTTFSLVIPALAGERIVAVGFVGITADIDVRDTDIYVTNYQAIRDYAGTEITLYSQGSVTVGDKGEAFFQKLTGGSPGTYVDNSNTVIVPTGGDGSIGWVRRSKGNLHVEDYGAKGDGTFNSMVAILAAESAAVAGDVICLEDGAVYACPTELVLTKSGITWKGKAEFKSTGSVAGDSAVVRVSSSAVGVVFDGPIFNANAQRARGLIIDTTCSECRVLKTDAFYYTATDCIGVHVPFDTAVTLAVEIVIQEPEPTSLTAVVGGTLLASTSYGAMITGTDCLGREGPGIVPSNATTLVRVSTTVPNKSVQLQFKTVPGARSYRMYFMNPAIVVDWERFYGVPIPITDPTTITHTVTSNWAGKPALPTVTQVPGSYQGLRYRPFFFRIAAYYSDGRGNHSGNSDGRVHSVMNSLTDIFRVAWAAPAGATPLGYMMLVSTDDTGGSRNFALAIDVGNVLTYDFDGADAAFLEFPYGNADEVVSPIGSRERNLSGAGKAIINGETWQSHSVPGTDNTYQLEYIATTGESEVIGSGSRNGLQFRKQYAGDSTVTVEWDICQNGNGKPITIWNLPLARPVGILHPEGFSAPNNSDCRVYLAAGVNNVTGNSTVYTVLFDNVDKNLDTNYATGTGKYTATVAALHKVHAEVLLSVAGATTSVEIRINRSVGANLHSSHTNIVANANMLLTIDREIELALGETVHIEIVGIGEASDLHDIVSSAARESFFNIKMI